MKKLILLFAFMVSIASSYAQKKLVLYYSETGTTKAVAEELQKQLNARHKDEHFSENDITVWVTKAEGEKCERC